MTVDERIVEHIVHFILAMAMIAFVFGCGFVAGIIYDLRSRRGSVLPELEQG